MKIKTTILITGICLNTASFAEENEQPKFASDSEIHLFELSIKDGNYTLSNGRNISNNPDYDSQPYFLPGKEKLLFSSARDGKQTDIYEYDIQSQKLTQVTHTKHSEFSPKPVGNTGNVSYVSEGNNPYNTVWQIDRNTNKESWLLNSTEPVGYYQVNHNNGDVLFWSRYGWSVKYLNIKTNQNRFVSGNAVPSSPQQIPNSNNFSFVHRQTNSMLWIKAFDPKAFSITHIAPIFDSNYEYAWAPNGDILRFDNNKLSVWRKDNKDFSWITMQDLSRQIKGKIARLTVSADGKYLALVEAR